MPRKHYHPTRQGHGPKTHFCAWPRCTDLVGMDTLMGRDHWLQVPWKLRMAYRDATQSGNQRAAERAAGVIKDWARTKDSEQHQTAGAR